MAIFPARRTLGEAQVPVETPGCWRYQDHMIYAEESCRHGVNLPLLRSYVCFRCHYLGGATATGTHLSQDKSITSSRCWTRTLQFDNFPVKFLSFVQYFFVMSPFLLFEMVTFNLWLYKMKYVT